MRSLLIVALLLATPAWAQDNGDDNGGDDTSGRLQLRTPQGKQPQQTPQGGGSGGTTGGRQAWRGALTDDASIDESCEVIAIDHARAAYVDGRYRATATVHCADGRTLAAVRPDEGLPFKFSACDSALPGEC